MKNRKYGRMVAMALAAMMAMPTVAFAAGTTWDEDTAYYGALEQGKVPEEVMKQDEMGQYVISDGTAANTEVAKNSLEGGRSWQKQLLCPSQTLQQTRLTATRSSIVYDKLVSAVQQTQHLNPKHLCRREQY